MVIRLRLLLILTSFLGLGLLTDTVDGELLAQPPKAPSLAEDLVKLQGTWQSPPDRKTGLFWRVTFVVVRENERVVEQNSTWWMAGDVPIRLPNGAVAYGSFAGSIGAHFELKAVGERRAITLPAKWVKQASQPSTFYYKFDGNSLVLTIEEGKLKGPYRLESAKTILPSQEWTGRFDDKIAQVDNPVLVTNQAGFAKYWKAWVSQDVPKIDFTKQLVVVNTAQKGRALTGMRLLLDSKGDAEPFVLFKGNPPFYAATYVITVFPRANIKSYNGQPLPKE